MKNELTEHEVELGATTYRVCGVYATNEEEAVEKALESLKDEVSSEWLEAAEPTAINGKPVPLKKVEAANVGGFNINAEGQYLYVNLPDGGQVAIQLDDEGVSVDIWNQDEEIAGSTYALYAELEPE